MDKETKKALKLIQYLLGRCKFQQIKDKTVYKEILEKYKELKVILDD